MSNVLDIEYFTAKGCQARKPAGDSGKKVFEAIEIATKVMRLCYPIRSVKNVHCYYNNAPIVPFMRAEHPDISDRPENDIYKIPCKEFVVIDVYVQFNDALSGRSEEDAFVVEVAFPDNKDLGRNRWRSLIRVRWADLNWDPNDSPVPALVGETFISEFM